MESLSPGLMIKILI